MEMLIAGHSVVDHIFRDEKETVLPGGIYYSALALASVKERDDTFYLLTSVDDVDFYRFKDLFGEFNLSFANKFKAVPHINLFTDGHGERGEHYREFISPLKYDKIGDWNRFDGILINMITGRDLSADDFVKIRKSFSGKIFVDIHTLSRGLNDHNHRFFRKIPDYEKYLSSANIVQVNEHELLTITPYDKLDKILETVFELGVDWLIITKGSSGVSAYSKNGDEIALNAEDVNSVNKIGCGDVFGSVFFYYFLKENDVRSPLVKANHAAALVTTYSNKNEMMKLKDDFFERFT